MSNLTPREANPFEPPERAPIDPFDVVGMVAAAILVGLSLALWLGWL